MIPHELIEAFVASRTEGDGTNMRSFSSGCRCNSRTGIGCDWLKKVIVLSATERANRS